MEQLKLTPLPVITTHQGIPIVTNNGGPTWERKMEQEKNVKITQSAKSDIPALLKEAAEIFSYICAANLRIESSDDPALADLHKRHYNFSQAYPTVLQHMIRDREYNKSAFEKYLHWLKDRPAAMKEDDFAEQYAHYYYLLMKAINGNVKAAILKKKKQEYKESILEYNKKFRDSVSKMKEGADEFEKKAAKEDRDNIERRFIETAKKGGMADSFILNTLNLVSTAKLSHDDLLAIIKQVELRNS